MEENSMKCPGCGNDQFTCFGLVAYTQRYDGSEPPLTLGRWAAMVPQWEEDYPLFVLCNRCDRNVTQLFLGAGILMDVYRESATPAKPQEERTVGNQDANIQNLLEAAMLLLANVLKYEDGICYACTLDAEVLEAAIQRFEPEYVMPTPGLYRPEPGPDCQAEVKGS